MLSEFVRYALPLAGTLMIACALTSLVSGAYLLLFNLRRSNQVLAMRNSYHGRAFATVGITGNRGWSASALSPVRVSYVHGGYPDRSPVRELSDAEYIEACVEDLRDVLRTGVHVANVRPSSGPIRNAPGAGMAARRICLALACSKAWSKPRAVG